MISLVTSTEGTSIWFLYTIPVKYGPGFFQYIAYFFFSGISMIVTDPRGTVMLSAVPQDSNSRDGCG